MVPGVFLWFFMVTGRFGLVPSWFLVFKVPGWFLWFQVGFYDLSWFQVDFSWLEVGFHGYRSVFMVPGRFSWFFMVPGCFFHIENTIKLYSDPAIQSRPCRP